MILTYFDYHIRCFSMSKYLRPVKQITRVPGKCTYTVT